MSPGLRHRLRILFGTRLGLSTAGRACAVQFGVLSGAAQLYLTFWPDSRLPRGATFLVLAGVALAGGIVQSWPRDRADHEFSHPEFGVTVAVGDLFDQPCHLVIGCNDVFDTDTTDDLVIARRSVQGQLLHRVYAGEVDRLDGELEVALTGKQPVRVEERATKRAGKLCRYPVGTVAVLGLPAQRYFLSAYGTMGNDLTISSKPDDIWLSLGELWRAVHVHARREAVAMPVIGSDLARIDSMDHAGLIKLILLSFVTRSRQSVICKELTIVVRPEEYERVDMLELAAFLRTL
ncbi:macro domain-containing protein [Streptomyces bicolor]|uniref:macro domain-containing protein n=1 Tax=Streptomyces bicolor TaxID=66874 RepID=UPI0004E1B811|nr:macro domain-containing protein [Streptomyces bicolor]